VSRILGIDYGEKRIGLALSDPTNTVAQPFQVLENKSRQYVIEEIQKLARKKDVAHLIVGLPKNMNGTLGIKAVEVLEFVENLKERIAFPVTAWDERLSSARAHRALRVSGMSLAKRKKRVDKVAAQVILQGYLDYLKKQKAEKDND